MVYNRYQRKQRVKYLDLFCSDGIVFDPFGNTAPVLISSLQGWEYRLPRQATSEELQSVLKNYARDLATSPGRLADDEES